MTEAADPSPPGGSNDGVSSTGQVLLVDDSALVRDFVGGLIGDWGFDVHIVASGKAALDMLAKQSFDVIVSDINMPEMSGIELLTTLRMRGVDTPVIMLSSVSHTREVLRAIHHGAFDYVVKDEAIEPLRMAIVRAVQHVRLVHENARLMQELARLNSELENRIKQRTAELEQANARLSDEHAEMEAAMSRLNETQEQLVQMEKMASIGLLTAGIAHEINNPLGFILPNFELAESWLEAARAGKAHERVRNLDDLAKLLGECRRGLDRIARLVRQLRIFSHPGRQELGPVDVDAVARSVVALVEREFSGHVAFTVYSSEDAVARANDDQLRQVLLNVIINAAHSFATPEKAGRIEVFVEPGAEEILVRVIDNGCGISSENLRRVFDPFFTTKPVGRGTGLGLSISRDLVKQMGGNITLESQVGRGTSVSIALHRWHDGAPAIPHREMLTPTPDLVMAPATRRLSIIIIEDETAMLLPLRRMLSDRHDVLTFSDPLDGMRCLIEREPPDAILCDINMPGMNGLDLYREVARLRPFLAPRFIFLTGGDSDELAMLMTEAPRRILEKPVHRKDLIAAIEAVTNSEAAPDSA
jgi:signal transduction histidine kinase